MQFTLEEVYSSIDKASSHIPVESLSNLIRFGEHKSAFIDKGPNFYQIREYDPERDSVTDIVWQLRDTSGKVYVRDSMITKEYAAVIMADLSTSMAFSSGYPFKLRMLLETIGNIGLTCVHGRDPLGFIGFSDQIIFDEPQRVGEDNLYFIVDELYKHLEFIVSSPPEKQKTDFEGAFDVFSSRYSDKKCFIFVISDFVRAEYLAQSEILKDLVSKHELAFIFLDDPMEFKIRAPFGYITRRDIETGEFTRVSIRQLKRSLRLARESRKQFRQSLNGLGVDSIVLEYGKHFDRLYRFLIGQHEAFKA